MTNAHVVDGVTRINITLFDGSEYQATLVGSDTNTDIAVVKIDANNLPAAVFADSSSVKIGDSAYVVGNPLGAELAFSFTCGHISSARREIAIEDTLMSLMQIDAAVNPGNSGGPPANAQGHIIGVINAKIVEEDVEGIGFAIPSNTALAIASELITHGYVASRPMLGITVESVQYDYAILYKDLLYRLLEKKIGCEYTVEQIIETLRSMKLTLLNTANGYVPSYTRTELTDTLHRSFGFRTDYEFIKKSTMRSIIKETKIINLSNTKI